MKLRPIIILLASTFLSGCSGIHFAEAPVNSPLPESFSQRSTYPSYVAGYKFEQLAGAIISVGPDKNLVRVGEVRATSSIPNAIPITSSLNYYHSRIQQGMSARGGYLAFAANLSADSLVDLELDDIAWASTELNDEVVSKLTEWVKTHPKPNANTSRFWVKSTVLTRQTLTYYVKIAANASGQVGEVTGVKTGVYRKSDSSSRSTIIGLDSFDIDQLVSTSQQNSKSFSLQLERARIAEAYKGIK